VPQILDFVDPDIDARLEALEREEDLLAEQHEAAQVRAQRTEFYIVFHEELHSSMKTYIVP
jgi:hypothetical protein